MINSQHFLLYWKLIIGHVVFILSKFFYHICFKSHVIYCVNKEKKFFFPLEDFSAIKKNPHLKIINTKMCFNLFEKPYLLIQLQLIHWALLHLNHVHFGFLFVAIAVEVALWIWLENIYSNRKSINSLPVRYFLFLYNSFWFYIFR